jgi:hypothetical protein
MTPVSTFASASTPLTPTLSPREREQQRPFSPYEGEKDRMRGQL